MKIKKTILILLALLLISITFLSVFYNLPILGNRIAYRLSYDYQTGNLNQQFKTKSASNNKNLDYFFGDSLFKYDSYKIKNDQVFYNGDWQNVVKTQMINQPIKVWKNDFQSKQLILFKPNPGTVKDLKIEIVSPTVNAPVLHANFILPIKANNKITNTSIYTGQYYSFDEIASDNQVLPEMKFDLQPILIYAKTNGQETPGNYQYEIKVSFTTNTQTSEAFAFNQEVNLMDYDVKSDPNYGTSNSQDFGYDSMTFPANAQKWIFPKNQSLVSRVLPTDLKVSGGDVSWMKWDYFKDKNNQAFLEGNKRQLYIDFQKQFNDDLNMSYGYTSDFGVNYLKYFVKNKQVNPDDQTSIPILSGQNGRLENILTNPDLELEVTFDVFDDYVRFLLDSGFKKIYIPVLARKADALPFLYTSQTYPFNFNGENSYADPLPLLSLKEKIIDNQGNITKIGQVFYEKLVSLIFQKLSAHIQEKYQQGPTGGYFSAQGDKMQFLISLDESSYEVGKYIWNLIQANDPHKIFASHGYLGWQFKANLKSDEVVKNRMINFLDEITIEQSGFVKYGDQVNQKINQERKKLGKITRYYSTWKHYPASYLGSNPAESFWAPMEGYKFGSNGYSRWETEGFKNNVTLDQADTSAVLEPGDAYQFYPGNGDGKPHYSLRMINYLESIKDVWKLKALVASKSNVDLITKLIDQVKYVDNGSQNTNYKWDLNYWSWNKILEFLQKNRKTLRVAEQTELVKMFIYYCPL